MRARKRTLTAAHPHKPPPTAAERKQRRASIDAYWNTQGWLDLRGIPVGLCQTCSACVPRADLTVSGGLVVCRACTRQAQG